MGKRERLWVLRGLLVAACAATASAACARTAGSKTPKQIVRNFLENVRSGRNPDASALYFAPFVRAHQVQSEDEQTLIRTPADYAAHVREFLTTFGAFSFSIENLLAEKNLVHVRWRQVGRHIGSLNGEKPTGAKLVELTSAVYRVEEGKIVEYWLQTDRKGMEIQIAHATAAGPCSGTE
ncbi:ester cyclase [Acetobacter persici]|uniref:ester cyclase n=1 Tax=Acetobacter persici TaxID=1076596 RepID=UPI0020CB9F4A